MVLEYLKHCSKVRGEVLVVYTKHVVPHKWYTDKWGKEYNNVGHEIFVRLRRKIGVRDKYAINIIILMVYLINLASFYHGEDVDEDTDCRTENKTLNHDHWMQE